MVKLVAFRFTSNPGEVTVGPAKPRRAPVKWLCRTRKKILNFIVEICQVLLIDLISYVTNY